MKQTAVEWLENEIFRRYKFTLQQLNCGPLEEAIQQAKEMERQQINSKKCYHPLTERKHTSDTHFECTICGYNNY